MAAAMLIGALNSGAVQPRAFTPPSPSERKPDVPPAEKTSPVARNRLSGLNGPSVRGNALIEAQEAREAEPKERAATPAKDELSEEDEARVRDLKQRDREVRAHEQAHASVGGQYAGSPSYEFERGPDGRAYAVAGHVSISTAPVPNDPEATVRKMEVVKRAALAPADPSSQDRRVAADAEAKRTAARQELSALKRDEMAAQLSGGEEETGAGAATPVSAALKNGLQSFSKSLARTAGIVPEGNQPALSLSV